MFLTNNENNIILCTGTATCECAWIDMAIYYVCSSFLVDSG